MTEHRDADASPYPEQRLWPHIHQSALDVEPWVKVRKAGLNLSSNEFVHPEVDRIVAEAMASIDAGRISAYAVPQELADALAGHHRIRPGGVVVTAGSDDAIRLLSAAVFSASKHLVLPEPNYALVRKYAQLNGVRVHSVELAGRSYRFTVADLADAVRRVGAPAAVYVSNPNGPVGCGFTLDEMAELATVCDAGGHLLVVDEAYVPYNGFDHLSLLEQFRSVVLVRSFSKSMGTAGARVAMIAADEQLVSYLQRWYPSNPVSGTAVHLMKSLLRKDDELARARREIVETREWFSGRIIEAFPHWMPVPSEANFVNFDVGSGARADDIAARLRSGGVHVRSMSAVPGLQRCLRVTMADRLTMQRVADLLIDAASPSATPAASHPDGHVADRASGHVGGTVTGGVRSGV